MRWRGSRRLRFAGAIMGEETEDGGWGSSCTSYVVEEAVELYCYCISFYFRAW